ncbi:hypothetical protein BDN67DRAFT_1038407 [Paxillus ammoniavirescens]|nr:hypothetical protein BDN67DRAFT_1038407 [Paxillus ammoniavirescens]
MDALHWSYADRLLTHPHPIPPPFTQEECQELIKLLNGEGDSHESLSLFDDEARIESSNDSSCTRIVARVLLRVAHWRKTHFRPYKPLPGDPRSAPIVLTVVQILIGIPRLGIPFMFVDRARYNGHFDVEGSHAPESTTPLFVIGACACLVSAIILSASVTLMSLPELDSIARIGGLVAITCLVLSMVTSFISIFRYKAEMARGVSRSGEGFMARSRRSIMLFLPRVFLADSGGVHHWHRHFPL